MQVIIPLGELLLIAGASFTVGSLVTLGLMIGFLRKQPEKKVE